jgi:adenylate kinase
MGGQAKGPVSEGNLVADRIVFSLVKKGIANSTRTRILLDGFPKTLDQAMKLDEILEEKEKKLFTVIYLEVPGNVMEERLKGMRLHPASGRVYNVNSNPPKETNKDDETGEELVEPEECRGDVMKTRLKQFRANIDSVLNYFEEKNLLHKVNADQDIEAVWKLVDEQVSDALDNYKEEKHRGVHPRDSASDEDGPEEARQRIVDEPKGQDNQNAT